MVCVVLALALTVDRGAHAESLSIEEWGQWNVVSAPISPGEVWQRYGTPEEAGWSSEKLSHVLEAAQSAGSAAGLVVYNGAVVTQWGEIERRFLCHSIRKSLLSALYGPAVRAGYIDLEETIEAAGIDDDSGLTPIEKSAKISDLLKSRSGIYLPAALETPSARNGRPKRGSHEPGTHWYYNNWDFNALATIYNKKTRGDLFEAFKSRIADPLQMQDFELRHTYYHLEPENSRHPGYRFRMSARDLARFGLLFLNEGRWKGAQIIPSEWVSESTKTYSVTLAGGYGYMWWTEIGLLDQLGTYTAYGYGGQAVYIVPGAKLVFVHRANTYDGRTVGNGAMRTMLRQILKARTAPPRANPGLVMMPNIQPVGPVRVLTDAQMASLTGQYRQNGIVATVRKIGGRLEVQSPRRGRFLLIPRSPTEFLVEDALWRLDFTLGGEDGPTKLRVWFGTDDEPYEMERVP
jgi:CubicO group peptidase (beta-lactamase class C family)